ncbi:MAG: phosphatase [Clostridiales bacterium]|nr:phosphatase [Clostridiales bacterium]
MDFILDTHCHTIASGHAYSTIAENAAAAAAKGLRLIAITDHAPEIPGSFGALHFTNLRCLPPKMYGVEILSGVELNILDFEGKVDLPQDLLRKLKVVIASLHLTCIQPGSVEENTRAILSAMQNECIKIIGHPGDPRFPIDIEKIVSAAQATGTVLEINDESLNPEGFRAGGDETILRMLKLCAQKKAYVVAASDAHISLRLGELERAKKLILASGIPEELVLNTNVKRFKEKLGLGETADD